MRTCNSTAGGITARPTSKSAAAKLDTKQLVTDRNLLVVITAAITRVLPTCNNAKKKSQLLKIYVNLNKDDKIALRLCIIESIFKFIKAIIIYILKCKLLKPLKTSCLSKIFMRPARH